MSVQGAAAWLEPAEDRDDHVRELAAGIAAKGSSADIAAWNYLCATSLDKDPNELRHFLGEVVCPRGLATFVHRLQRRAVGLADDWTSFCHEKGQKTIDPHRLEPWLLLEFVIWAIRVAPEKVAVVKGPFDSFMEVAVDVARRCMMGETFHASVTSQTEEMADQLRTVLGIQNASDSKDGAQTKVARLIDAKDDSTMSGSVLSKSDRSESGASDHEGPILDNLEPQSSSLLWLGPEPESPEDSPQNHIPPTRLMYQ